MDALPTVYTPTTPMSSIVITIIATIIVVKGVPIAYSFIQSWIRNYRFKQTDVAVVTENEAVVMEPNEWADFTELSESERENVKRRLVYVMGREITDSSLYWDNHFEWIKYYVNPITRDYGYSDQKFDRSNMDVINEMIKNKAHLATYENYGNYEYRLVVFCNDYTKEVRMSDPRLDLVHLPTLKVKYDYEVKQMELLREELDTMFRLGNYDANNYKCVLSTYNNSSRVVSQIGKNIRELLYVKSLKD